MKTANAINDTNICNVIVCLSELLEVIALHSNLITQHNFIPFVLDISRVCKNVHANLKSRLQLDQR